MHTPDQFNLTEAIEAYLHQIDRNHPLSPEERDELLDHLLTESESFLAEGLSEEVAFKLSIEQFGSTELIGREFRRAKPFYSVRRAAIAVSLLTFLIIFIVGTTYALSAGVAVIDSHFSLDKVTSQVLDLLLKSIFLLGAIYYIRQCYLKQSTIKTWQAVLIPILGLTAPFYKVIVTQLFFMSGRYLPSKVLMIGVYNNLIIFPVILIGLLILCYRLIFKWRRAKRRSIAEISADSKAEIGILVAFFLSLIIFSLINIITDFSLWLALHGVLAEEWIRLIDLIFKLSLLLGALAVVRSRIERQVFFKQWELLLIPLIGILSPYLIDLILFVIIPSGSKSLVTIFGQLSYNSMIVIGCTFLIVAITTYILLYQEHRQLKIAGD